VSTIRVKVSAPDQPGGFRWVATRAWSSIVRPLVVTSMQGAPGYVVTHQKSGLSIGDPFRTLALAREACAVFLPLTDWDAIDTNSLGTLANLAFLVREARATIDETKPVRATRNPCRNR
jgi:hypothetical protein